jgi:YHS domain-containing protein
MSKDPVCGMEVDEGSKFTSEHGGQTYYFCSQECEETFKAKPDQYTERAA